MVSTTGEAEGFLGLTFLRVTFLAGLVRFGLSFVRRFFAVVFRADRFADFRRRGLRTLRPIDFLFLSVARFLFVDLRDPNNIEIELNFESKNETGA